MPRKLCIDYEFTAQQIRKFAGKLSQSRLADELNLSVTSVRSIAKRYGIDIKVRSERRKKVEDFIRQNPEMKMKQISKELKISYAAAQYYYYQVFPEKKKNREFSPTKTNEEIFDFNNFDIMTGWKM